jgi:predicted DsbA family dithiol-disulfide isomerase
MELEVREIVQQMQLDAQVERVEDLEKILQSGLTALPGLMIDGRVVANGYAGRKKLELILRDVAALNNNQS